MSNLSITLPELTQLRADAAALVCDTACVIERFMPTKDGYGTNTKVWTPVSPDGLLVGLDEPSAGQLTNYAYLIGSLATWKVSLPYGTDVQRQDHLLVAGQVMIVQVDLSKRSYGILTVVLASEVK